MLTLLGIVEGGELPVLRIAFTLATLGLAAADLKMQSSYRNVVDRNDRDVIYGFRCVLATQPEGRMRISELLASALAKNQSCA